jgi:hypothetical protein
MLQTTNGQTLGVVAIGASAGGAEVLSLPVAGLLTRILITQHGTKLTALFRSAALPFQSHSVGILPPASRHVTTCLDDGALGRGARRAVPDQLAQRRIEQPIWTVIA